MGGAHDVRKGQLSRLNARDPQPLTDLPPRQATLTEPDRSAAQCQDLLFDFTARPHGAAV
jgi:hypothetical protein